MELMLTAITQAFQQDSRQGVRPIQESQPADRPAMLPIPAEGWSLRYEASPQAESWALWQSLASQESDLFLDPAYLQLLQDYAPKGVKTALAFFYQQEVLMGGLVIQFFTFSAVEQLRLAENQADITTWQRQINKLRLSVASCLECRVLVGGQLLATGEHGLSGHKSPPATVLAQGLESLAKYLVAKGERIDALLSKELPGEPEAWKATGFIPLPMQPNMVLHLQPHWQSFDDYAQAMSSKYRVRLRRARKKMNGITRRELSLAEIIEQEALLIGYYEEVISGADFNAVHVHPHYFSALKTALPDQFRLWGYYEGENLIGFCTALRHHTEMDAHFLGFSQAHNIPYQLYLNMLYDLVDEGIRAGVASLVFARTAMEIKSSVGAVPESAPAYMRLRRPALHAAAPCLVDWLAPAGDWVQRHPFKEE